LDKDVVEAERLLACQPRPDGSQEVLADEGTEVSWQELASLIRE
jgi:hypothetical protein